MRRALWVLLLCVLAAATGDAQTRSKEEVSREALKLFNTVMSPYCPGALLADCTSSKAAVLRDEIRAELARGRDPQEIVDELIVDYGQQILGAPPLAGAGIVGHRRWLAPVLRRGFCPFWHWSLGCGSYIAGWGSAASSRLNKWQNRCTNTTSVCGKRCARS